MTITVNGPDGATYNFPDDTAPAEMTSAMAKVYPHPSETAQPPPQDPGIAANAARALRMGLPFGNQMVAAEKTLLPQSLGGSQGFDYGKNLQDVNAADARLQQEHPVIADLGQGTGAALGALAVPAAALGEGAQGFGLMGRAARGGIAGAGIGAVQGAGAPGSDIRDLPQTAEGAIGGAATGGALGAAFPVAGAAIGKAVSPLAEALRGGPGQSDLAALQAAKAAAYKKVEDLGAAYSPEAYQRLVDKITSDAQALRINPGLEPGATSAISDMQLAAAKGQPIPLSVLDQDRQIAWGKAGSKPDARERMFGGIIRSNIDDLTNTAFPGDMAPMPSAAPQASLRAMTPEEEAAGSATPPRPQVPPGPAPVPMLDFLRRGGGLQDEGGDLASMGLSNLNGPAAKGSSKIIDKENGRPMDEGLRAAKEAGYMEPHETVSDFINKIGDHPTYSVHDEPAVGARAARDAYDFGPGESEPRDWESPQSSQNAVAPIPPGPVASAQDAADAIQNARDLAQRQFKANALATALSKAEDRADVAGTGGNIENTTRQKLLNARDKESWSPDELSQLNTMIHGTPVTNTLRQFSRFGPKGNALMTALELGAIGTGNPALMAAGIAGTGAQAAGALMRRNAQNKLMSTILAGGKAPAQITAPPTRAAIAAALAANADLQARRNQATQP